MGYEEGLSRVPFLIAREVWETGSDPPQILKFFWGLKNSKVVFGVSCNRRKFLSEKIVNWPI